MKGRKRHILVDPLGLLLAVVVRAASVQDRQAAAWVLTAACMSGYTVHKVWKVDGTEIDVMQRQERGFQLLPRRWGVERTFAWLSQNRRLSRDYEELAQTSEGWVYLGMVRLMLRRLTA